MKLKKGYKFYYVDKGKIHILNELDDNWLILYLCGMDYSSADIKINNNKIVKENSVCKNCLKSWNKIK